MKHDGEYCMKSPFYHGVDWGGAAYSVQNGELREFGNIGESSSLLRLVIVAAVHDAAALYNPRTLTENTAPMAVALIRDGRCSRESISHISRYLASAPGRAENIEEVQRAANETLTNFGMAHTNPLLFEDRVADATHVFQRLDELSIEQRLAPITMGVENDAVDALGL